MNLELVNGVGCRKNWETTILSTIRYPNTALQFGGGLQKLREKIQRENPVARRDPKVTPPWVRWAINAKYRMDISEFLFTYAEEILVILGSSECISSSLFKVETYVYQTQSWIADDDDDLVRF